eukprot:jgi/Mesvir1/20920/Mv07991-RA.1
MAGISVLLVLFTFFILGNAQPPLCTNWQLQDSDGCSYQGTFSPADNNGAFLLVLVSECFTINVLGTAMNEDGTQGVGMAMYESGGGGEVTSSVLTFNLGPDRNTVSVEEKWTSTPKDGSPPYSGVTTFDGQCAGPPPSEDRVSVFIPECGETLRIPKSQQAIYANKNRAPMATAEASTCLRNEANFAS